MFRLTLLALLAGFLCTCGRAPQEDPSPMTDAELRAHANELAHRYLITDGHVDLPYRLKVKNFRLDKEYLGIPIETSEGDFDYVRAVEGGLDAPFMSIYIPSGLQAEPGASPALADSLIAMVRGIAEAHPDKFRIATSPAELEQNFRDSVMSLPMGMENGSPIEDKIERVAEYHAKGIRYITLTHGKDNLICDSSYDTTRTHGGLSEFGREVVREMNRVGIMVDISHVSDSTFWQVVEMTDVPVIASHSSARKFTPGFERNMDDAMIKRLGEEGGVIQINFGSTFLDGKLRIRQDSLRGILQERLAAADLQYRDEAAKPLIEAFEKEFPTLYADVETVADHIDHVVALAGIDHVGLGSDFDGVGDSLPTGLKDVSDYPNLIYTLLKRGYSDDDIQKICSGNVLRVWRAVEAAATAQ
ncbi:dipeptidase [Neolewinella lacunae]|uniref:Membrane dipeptidase n=1 Tax=Neolewinella lacunae TaxID=1517758 RepID=A0A923T8N7_9BACT|nr:dipeptidase [Neolewinella lacunae]MBC6994764.1 membrane dipeptidase [Neolewinella lacunae]MDN3634386.1 dipeptidase [Neolewinella lacunae]